MSNELDSDNSRELASAREARKALNLMNMVHRAVVRDDPGYADGLLGVTRRDHPAAYAHLTNSWLLGTAPRPGEPEWPQWSEEERANLNECIRQAVREGQP